MKHLHTKIRHHVREKKNHYIASLVSLVLFFVVVGSAFFFTKSSDPHVSELAFTEHSTLGNSAGSVVPASCGSFDHGLRTTCWDGRVINPECDACTEQPKDCAGVPGGGAVVDYCGVCNGGVTGPNWCDGANPGDFFTDQSCTTACGASRSGSNVRTCANGGLSGPVDCPVVPSCTPDGSCAASTCSGSNCSDLCGNWYAGTMSCPTGSWVFPECPSACGQAASTQWQVCSGGGCAGSPSSRTCPATTACVPNTNCVGGWVDNGVCSVSSCGQTGTYGQTYVVTTPQSGTGSSCVPTNGTIRATGGAACSTAACPPSGTISASPNPCLIANGATSCSTSVTWATYDPTGSSDVTRNNPAGTVASSQNSGTRSAVIDGVYAAVSFYLYHGSLLASTDVSSRCIDGHYWNGAAGCAPCQNLGCVGTGGSVTNPYGGLTCIEAGVTNVPICKNKPTVSITLDNSTDLYISNYPNNNAAIRWDGTAGTDPDSCTIPSGNWSNAAATALPFKYTGPSALTDQLRTGGQFTYSYSCTNVGGSTLANAKVTVCDSMTPVLHPGNICLPAPVAGLSFVSGNYTSNAVVRLSCTNSSFYKLKKNGVTVDSGVIPEAATSYAKNVNISSEGDYTLECDYTSTDGHLFDSFSANTLKYRTKPPEPVVTLMANPVSISRGSASVISWIVMFPNSVQSPVRTPACVLTAAPVCTGACTAAQNAASTTVNAILRNENTDSSDPRGSRKINPTAVNTLPAGHDPEDWRATGRKTINLEKSMDFKLKCGGVGTQSSSTVRVIVTSSNEG